MSKTSTRERQQTEKADRQSEAGLIGAQRLMLVGYWDWNLKTNKYSWCDEMFRIFNLTPQEFPPRTGTYLNSVHPEDRGKIVQALGKALVGEQPYNMEHRIVWPDGSVRHVHGKAEVTFEDGRPVRVLGIVKDITDRRQVEES